MPRSFAPAILLTAIVACAAVGASVRIIPPDDPAYNPLSWAGDGFLPFPSNVYTVDDPSSPTGLRLHLPRTGRLNEILPLLPFQTDWVLDRIPLKDGFSPNFPIVVSVSAVLDDSHLPSPEQSVEPDSPIALFNTADGRPVAFRSFLDVVRRPGGRSVSVVKIYPLGALEKGARHVVLVRKNLGHLGDAPLTPSRGFVDMTNPQSLPGDQDARTWERHAPLRAFLNEHAEKTSNLLLAFDFTVESDESYTRPLRDLARLLEEHASISPFEAHVEETGRYRTLWDRAEAVEVVGYFDGVSVVDEKGAFVERPTPRRIEFKLLVPRRTTGPVPLVIFGHGLGVNKDTMFQVAGRLIEKGYAVVGVNAPHHDFILSPIKVIFGARKNMALFSGMLYQYLAHQLMLLDVLRDAQNGLAALDVLPYEGEKDHGDGIPDLDSSNMVYIGQSMGGIVGASVLALDPGLKGGVLNVAGGTFGDMFEDTFLVEEFGLPVFDVSGLSRLEAYVAAGFTGYLTDGIDPVGVAPYISRNKFLTQTSKTVMVQAGLNDGLVPNGASDRLARALAIPAIRPIPHRQIPMIDLVDRPYDGPGLYYYRFGQGRFLPHLCLMGDEAASDAVKFLSGLLTEHGPRP